MSISTAALLAKPLVCSTCGGKRSSVSGRGRRGSLIRAASKGPQWSTDKTLYGEEKIDLKLGERLQCVRFLSSQHPSGLFRRT